MSDYRFDPQCVDCILGRFLNKAPRGSGPDAETAYKLKVLKIISEAGEDLTAPEIVAAVTECKNEMFGEIDDYADIKRHFNRLMLSLADEVEQHIQNASDPLKTAMKFAQLGNYIDFGATDSVDEKELKEMLKGVDGISLCDSEFDNFKADLAKARSLVYLTDNCGEVVLDKLLIRQLKKQYKDLDITVIVRGGAALNDATLSDAREVGLSDEVRVLGNGDAVAGTCLHRLPQEVRETVDRADVIISKGQGNFETLQYSGLNIYYLFLCKCKMFCDKFGVPKYSGMFLNDRRMK